MKHLLNKFTAVVLCCAMALSVSCSEDYQSDIDSLSDRVTALESAVAAIESEIAAGAIITSVTSATDGVTLTLSSGTSYTITNGADGADGVDGADGADGSVVEIIDGNWYIDGEDTGLSAGTEDAEDSEGADGADGAEGAEGAAGEDGAPGDYYYPVASEGVFYLYSWDAETEAYVGTATDISCYAENAIVSGAALAVYNAETGGVEVYAYSAATGTYEEVWTLSTTAVRITSMLVSEAYGDGFIFESGETMPFAHIYYLPFYDENEVLFTALSSTNTYKYVVNPSQATAPDAWSVNFVTVQTKTATSNDYFAYNQDDIVSLEDGFATLVGRFDYVSINTFDVDDAETRFSLQANYSDESYEDVLSNSAIVEGTSIKDVFIGDAYSNAEYKSAAVEADDYRTYVPSLVTVDNHKGKQSSNDTSYCDHYIYMGAEAIDLETYVYGSTFEKIASESGREWLNNYNIFDYSFEFSLDIAYEGVDDYTEQNKFVTLDGSMLAVSAGSSAEGRTPVVQVNLLSDTAFGEETVIATVYIKFLISEVPAVEKDPVYFELEDLDIPYKNLYADLETDENTYEFESDWEYMNFTVYENSALNLSHDVFVTRYAYENPVFEVTPTDVTDTFYGAIYDLTEDKINDVGTTPTVSYAIQVNPRTNWGEYTATVTYKSLYPYEYGDIVISQIITVEEADEALPTFNSDYAKTYSLDTYLSDVIYQVTKGRQYDDRHEMTVLTSEAFGSNGVNYLRDYVKTEAEIEDTYRNTPTFSVDINLPAGDTLLDSVALLYYAATSVEGYNVDYFDADTQSAIDQLTAQINKTQKNSPCYTSLVARLAVLEASYSTAYVAGIQDQVLYLTKPLSVPYIDVPMIFAITYENGDTQTEEWTIRFVNPLSVELDTMEIATTDGTTYLDISGVVTLTWTDIYNVSTVVYQNGVWNETLKAKYGLSEQTFSAVIDYVKVTPNVAVGDYAGLTFDDKTGIFSWNNGGSALYNDVTESAKVTVVYQGNYDEDTYENAYATTTTSGYLTIKKGGDLE